MKKTLYLLGIAALMTAACSRETLLQSPESTVEALSKSTLNAGETVQITATLPQVERIDTRVSLAENTAGGFTLSWERGDQLSVGDETFTLVSSEGARGVFEGKVPQGSRFDIRVLAPEASATPPAQKANGDFSHLRYTASLTGVDSFEDIQFNHGWAAQHGGSFAQSGCLCLVLNLRPETAEITSVSFSSEGIPECALDVENGTLTGQRFTAYLPAGEMTLSADKKVTVKVTEKSGTAYTNTFLPGPQTLYQGYVHRLVTSASNWYRVQTATGSEADPYLISSVSDFDNIRNLIEENAHTYFRMTQNIDFSGVTNWVPINQNNDPYGIMFDGGGFTLSHFKCTHSNYASLFGILHGEVKDLTIADSEITTTTNSPCGLVAGWVGNMGGTLQGRLKDVHAVRSKVSNSGATNYFGGLAGRSGNGSFADCSFDGTVERTSTAAYNATYYPVGGILGEAKSDVSISGCYSSGTLSVKSGRSCGGILGKCDTSIDITDCHSSMNITSRDDVVGGIVGYYGNGTISGCTVAADITVTAKGSGKSYVGGIAGHTYGSVLLERCSYEGNLTAAYGVVGGILGQCNTSTGTGATIRQCVSSGKITGPTFLGGIAGQASNSGLNISDCGSSMTIAGTGSYVGGLVGDAPKNTAVRNCFATGSVTGAYAIGGLIGRAFGKQGSSASLDDDVNTSVESCIAFNPSVKTTTDGGENPASHYSGGAVIGCSTRVNTLKDCRRNPAMEFDYFNDASLNVLFDHDDSSPEHPLTQAAGSAKWYSPYHGKAASAGSSVSSIALSLNWSLEIWDLSGSVPVLKWTQP